MAENPYVAFVKRYRNDPVDFVEQVLNQSPDPWQKEFLNAVASGERKISIRSGHGTGKSTAASWVMLHYLITGYHVKIVVTAPTSAQLFDALFAELKRWINECPVAIKELLEVKSDRVSLKAAPSEACISCRTSRAETSEALQGVHADNVLMPTENKTLLVGHQCAAQAKQDQITRAGLLGDVRGVYSRMGDKAMKLAWPNFAATVNRTLHCLKR